MEQDFLQAYSNHVAFLNDAERMRFALNAAGIGVWEMDVAGNDVIWDDQCRALFGLAKDNKLPYAEAIQYIHLDDVLAVDEKVKAAIGGEKNSVYDATYRTIGADDGILRWVNFTGIAYFDDNQQLTRFGGVAREVTDKMLAQQAIEENKAFLKLLYDSVPAMIFYLDDKQRYTSYNRVFEQWFGVGPTEALGKTTREMVGEVAYAQIEPQLARAYAGERVEFEIESPTPLGEGRWLCVVYTPHKRVNGTVAGLVVHIGDVTAETKARQLLQGNEILLQSEVENRTKDLATVNNSLQNANNELLRSNEELAQFAYIASHDLQEPLRKIQLFTNMLAQSCEFPANLRSILDKVNKSGARMSVLIHDLLDFSRVQQTDVRWEEVNLQQTVRGVLDDLDALMKEKKAVIQVESLPVIEAVTFQMQQLLHNLLGNALKFTREGILPTITVSCSEEEAADDGEQMSGQPYYHIAISDNGIGFNGEHADQIFELFKRLHGGDEYAGTGLGLAICKRIVENHHGRIYTEPNPTGGAVFHVLLPKRGAQLAGAFVLQAP